MQINSIAGHNTSPTNLIDKYLNSQTKNQEKKKFSDYLTPKNIAFGAVVVTAAVLCAYGIIKNVQKGKIKEAKELLPVKPNQCDIIIDSKDKFKKILEPLTHDDYDSSKIFRANFHIHSKLSDGQLEPLEILRQANEYAQKLPANEKFSFSLTDHDSIKGVKEIYSEICKNPEKYKKLNFVPGIELSTTYKNFDIARNPVELDFLIYGFDVENPVLQSVIEQRKNYLLTKTQNLFNDINSQYKTAGLSLEDMMKQSSNGHLKNICSNGYLKSLRTYITKTLEKSNIPFSERLIDKKTIEHFNNPKIALDANIGFLDAVKLTKDINGFCSIAHPGKFNFNNAELKQDGLVFSDDIISQFIKAGGDGIESHYMCYKPNNQNWWERIRNSFKKLNLTYLRTGGYDTHNLDIGKH